MSTNSYYKRDTHLKPVIALAAIQLDRGIGANGNLLVRVASDLAAFKKRTLNNVVLMGRNTWESIPGDLVGRTCLILSSNPIEGLPENAKAFTDPQEMLDYAQALPNEKTVFIIGGASLYNLYLNGCTSIELTTHLSNFGRADTFFPDLPKRQWELTSSVVSKRASEPTYKVNTYKNRSL